MSEIARPESFLTEIELLLSEGKYDVAKASLLQHLEQHPADRESSLYLLLVNATLTGPETYEAEIDRLRNLLDLNNTERDVVRRLFIIGFKAAEEAGREDQAWAYQRLLRRLLLDQELDRSIPRSATASAPSLCQQFIPEPTVDRVPLQKSRIEWLGGTVMWIRGISGVMQYRLQASMRLLRRTPEIFHHVNLKASFTNWMPNMPSRRAFVTATAVLLAVPAAYFLATQHYLRKELSSNATASSTVATISEPEPADAPAPVAIRANVSEPDGLSLKRVRSVVTAYLSHLRAVYNEATEKNPNLMGSVSIKITVDEVGNIVKAEDAGSRLSDAAFVEMVLDEVQKWKFPKTAGNGEFTLPLLFVPEGMDPRTIVRWEKTVNAAASEAKVLRTIIITNSSKPVRDRRQVEVAEEKPAEFKIQRTGLTTVSRIRNIEEPAKRTIEYRTLRRAPLREKPRFAAATTEDVGPGTAIQVLETKGDWLKVRARSSGSVGYVRKEYVMAANATQ